jgi:hypothetical protein
VGVGAAVEGRRVACWRSCTTAITAPPPYRCTTHTHLPPPKAGTLLYADAYTGIDCAVSGSSLANQPFALRPVSNPWPVMRGVQDDVDWAAKLLGKGTGGREVVAVRPAINDARVALLQATYTPLHRVGKHTVALPWCCRFIHVAGQWEIDGTDAWSLGLWYHGLRCLTLRLSV